MKKSKTSFYCTSCGHESVQWLGRCPACGDWNTFREAPQSKAERSLGEDLSVNSFSRPVLLEDVEAFSVQRTPLAFPELNLVLGGGVVPGSVVLLAGEPGIGKSTLALQSLLGLEKRTTLYVSGEESAAQIHQRALRLKSDNNACHVLTDITLPTILEAVTELRPAVVVVDSVQTLVDPRLEAAPGSIIQIRESTASMISLARRSQIPFVLIGHVNKEGDIAGPKLLEHMVDVVLQFEGDRHHHYRMIRALKNRFGSTQEIGIFEMTAQGLREVHDPSRVFVSASSEPLSGSALCLASEGTRAFLVEVQALVAPAVFGTPQRMTYGFETRRLNMLLAVLEKRCGLRFHQKDVFVNVTGGLRLEDPASDLAVTAAILSSWADVPLNRYWAFSGEVGLTGEVRPVQRLEQRLSEAQRMGIKKIVLSETHQKEWGNSPLQPLYVKKVQDLLSSALSLKNQTFPAES